MFNIAKHCVSWLIITWKLTNLFQVRQKQGSNFTSYFFEIWKMLMLTMILLSSCGHHHYSYELFQFAADTKRRKSLPTLLEREKEKRLQLLRRSFLLVWFWCIHNQSILRIRKLIFLKGAKQKFIYLVVRDLINLISSPWFGSAN